MNRINIVFPGVIASQNGTLSFLVGGSKAGFEQAKPILECMGQNIFHCGGTATGQVENNYLFTIIYSFLGIIICDFLVTLNITSK